VLPRSLPSHSLFSLHFLLLPLKSARIKHREKFADVNRTYSDERICCPV